MTEDYDKLMRYAFGILSKKRYTAFELQKKLELYCKKHDINLEYTVPSLLRLEELNYINDEQFARDYVSQRIRLKPKGVFLLKRELRHKGINKEIIETLFNEIDIDEFGLAKSLLVQQMKKWLKLPTQKQKAKAFQFLGSRGFAADTIYKIIDSCYNHDS